MTAPKRGGGEKRSEDREREYANNSIAPKGNKEKRDRERVCE